MLEGQEIREFKLSDCFHNKDYRIDTDYYIKTPQKNGNLQYKEIGECLFYSQYGISIEMNEENKGYPIYRMNEIHDMLCDLNVDKYADIEEDVFQSFQLKDGDVLFNRTNSYDFVGRTAIYYDNDGVNRTFASYLVKLKPNPNIILPEYLTTYLNTKQGIQDIKRHARQSINQTNVNPEEVKEMEIPILSMSFQEKIKNNLVLANKKRCQSQVLYSDTQRLLLDNLYLSDWHPSNNQVNVKSLNESFLSSGRLDAEHYQMKYDELEAMIKTVPYKTIAEIQLFNARGVQPDYVEEGCISVVNSKHILEDGLDYDNFERTTEAFLLSQKRAQIGYGDILIYTTGANIGRTQAYLKHNHALASNHVNILRVKGVNPIYLALVLNSPIGRLQTEKLCTGSAQVEIYPNDIEKFVVPILDETIQETIASKVQESFAMKTESKRLLNVAKEAVEIAISDSEEKAQQYIIKNENGESLYD